MADEPGDAPDSTPSEEALERMLMERGPLLRRRLEAGSPDAAFVARLRARLLGEEAAAPEPGAVPGGVGSPAAGAAQDLTRAPRRLRWAVMGLAAALLVAALIAVVVIAQPHQPARRPAVAWQPPVPSVADLTRGFPAPPGTRAATALDPTVSLAAPPPGRPYAGRVALSTAPLPTRAFRLLAFRLLTPSAVASPQRVTLLARLLGLRGPSRRLVRGHAPWIVVAEGGPPSPRPLHSIAVSAASGEVVYHDASYVRTIGREVWRNNPSAVAAARRWLARLGWPGARMPLVAVEHSGVPAGLREIEFAWAGAGAVATDAATLWVTPAGRVVEADVWPPVESVRAMAARSMAAAWAAVRDRLVPLAVEGVSPATAAPGAGVMRHVTVTQVLSTGRDHRLYLVPTYHFAGTARLRGIQGARPCYSLAPAART